MKVVTKARTTSPREQIVDQIETKLRRGETLAMVLDQIKLDEKLKALAGGSITPENRDAYNAVREFLTQNAGYLVLKED